MRRLIVNADDFGMTPGVSAGILAARRHGIVTSTTVLVTAGPDPESVAAARDAGLGIGLHVNLTLGRPLTGAHSLIGPDGRFVRDARRAAAMANVPDIEKEIEAQVEQFERIFGHGPTHVDTHHHIGLHAPVAGVVL
ncbi:MAG: ChbG/HpnK family deacetylase, partial [Candidatus Rokubacteria bacterium]|nr:ChbG/HpnK family deacetylase [Candidatus Rokubacteria bacterium]